MITCMKDLKEMRRTFIFEFNIEFELGHEHVEGIGKIRIIDAIDKIDEDEIRLFNARDIINGMGYGTQESQGKNGTCYSKFVKKFCNEDSYMTIFNSDLKRKVYDYDPIFELKSRGDLYIDKEGLEDLIKKSKINKK